MIYLFWSGLLVLSSLLLFAHFSWAMIDPHNPPARPGRLSTIIRSVALTLGLVVAAGLSSPDIRSAAAILFSFCLGMVMGPAINAPNEPRIDEEPSLLARKLEATRVALGGIAMKSVVVIPLTWLIALTGLPHPWYIALTAVALVLNLAKTGAVMTMLDHFPVRDSLRSAGMELTKHDALRLSLRGTLALALWSSLLFPFLDSIPHPTLQDWLSIAAIIVGLIVAVVR